MLSTYKGKMSSNSQEYETPDEIFIPLHKEFNFDMDLAASHINHKLSLYWTKEDNMFTKKITGVNWLNPEFFTVGKFIKYVYSNLGDAIVVSLIMVKSNTNWWRDCVMKAKEVRFINQKVQFKGTKQGLRFPMCVVIFQKHKGETRFTVFKQQNQSRDRAS